MQPMENIVSPVSKQISVIQSLQKFTASLCPRTSWLLPRPSPFDALLLRYFSWQRNNRRLSIRVLLGEKPHMNRADVNWKFRPNSWVFHCHAIQHPHPVLYLKTNKYDGLEQRCPWIVQWGVGMVEWIVCWTWFDSQFEEQICLSRHSRPFRTTSPNEGDPPTELPSRWGMWVQAESSSGQFLEVSDTIQDTKE